MPHLVHWSIRIRTVEGVEPGQVEKPWVIGIVVEVGGDGTVCAEMFLQSRTHVARSWGLEELILEVRWNAEDEITG